MPQLDICRLCKKEASLCDSHIIPEFNFKPLYDEKHRLNIVSTDPEVRDRYAQKGFREKLLCLSCENAFSRWEDYAKRIIHDDGLFIIQRDERVMRLGGADYKTLKLYLLSLIWRMGVSNLEFFQLVDLGPYERKIRSLLAAGEPGPDTKYPCLLTGVRIEGEFRTEWISPPDRIIVGNKTVYRFVIAGVLYTQYVTDKPFAFDISEVTVNKKGEVFIMVEDEENIPFLHERLLHQARAIQARRRRKRTMALLGKSYWKGWMFNTTHLFHRKTLWRKRVGIFLVDLLWP